MVIEEEDGFVYCQRNIQTMSTSCQPLSSLLSSVGVFQYYLLVRKQDVLLFSVNKASSKSTEPKNEQHKHQQHQSISSRTMFHRNSDHTTIHRWRLYLQQYPKRIIVTIVKFCI